MKMKWRWVRINRVKENFTSSWLVCNVKCFLFFISEFMCMMTLQNLWYSWRKYVCTAKRGKNTSYLNNSFIHSRLTIFSPYGNAKSKIFYSIMIVPESETNSTRI